MTETHPTYLTFTGTAPAPGAKPPLRYRLTLPTGTSITLEPTSADGLAAACDESTLGFVVNIFRSCRPAGANAVPHDYSNCVPEILSQATLDRVDELESLLEACRNTLIDAVRPSYMSADHYDELIDDAGKALGYPKDLGAAPAADPTPTPEPT